MVDEPAWKSCVPEVARQVRRAAAHAFARAGNAAPGAEVTILLSNDGRLQTLNRQYCGKDKPTNVLSFPVAPGASHLGDIAIAFETSHREAENAGKPLVHHLLHLTVHGVLHLLGYDHEKEVQAARMERLEAEILAEMGIPDPYNMRHEIV